MASLLHKKAAKNLISEMNIVQNMRKICRVSQNKFNVRSISEVQKKVIIKTDSKTGKGCCAMFAVHFAEPMRHDFHIEIEFFINYKQRLVIRDDSECYLWNSQSNRK